MPYTPFFSSIWSELYINSSRGFLLKNFVLSSLVLHSIVAESYERGLVHRSIVEAISMRWKGNVSLGRCNKETTTHYRLFFSASVETAVEAIQFG